MLDHGSNSGKRFSKWPPKVILKNLYVNMFCTSWSIFMIKISSRGFFKVLNRLEKVLVWPEVRIMQNSKWLPFLLQQILLLLFISRFIIDTGSPWARICHHAPPPLSTSIRGVLGMLLAMLRGITLWRDMGFGHFYLNGRHENLIWAIFSPKLTYNHNFGVYTYVFRVKKSNETTYISIGSFLYG